MSRRRRGNSSLEILQWLTATIRGLSKKKHAAKTATESIVQLQGLDVVLKDVQRRWKDSSLSLLQLQGLSPVIAQLQTELSKLPCRLKVQKSHKGS